MRDVIVPIGTPPDTIELRANEQVFARPYADNYIEVFAVVNDEDTMPKEQRLRFRKQQRRFKQQLRNM